MGNEQSGAVSYGGKQYEIVEDLVVKQKDKRKFLILVNIISIVVMLIVAAAGIAAILLLHEKGAAQFNFVAFLLLMLSFIAYIFVHEFLHGLAFRIAGKVPWKHISYGVVVKSGMAYCISEVPVPLSASRISLLAPFVLVCVPVIAFSIIFGNIALLIAGAFYTSGSAGDFWYLWILRKKPKDLYMIEEKPTGGEYNLGCRLVRPVEE